MQTLKLKCGEEIRLGAIAPTEDAADLAEMLATLMEAPGGDVEVGGATLLRMLPKARRVLMESLRSAGCEDPDGVLRKVQGGELVELAMAALCGFFRSEEPEGQPAGSEGPA